MINISQNFKNAMTAPVKILRGEIREISENLATENAENLETENPETVPQIFASGDNLISFSVDASGYYFGAATRSLEFRAIGTNFDAIDKTFAVKIGAQIDSENEIFEDLDLGKFVVYEQTSDLEKEITTFRAYDLMGIFAKKLYSENILTFPCTVANLAQQIAASENILLDENFANLPNANYEIAQDLYEKIANTTFRDIIAEIAGATASLAKISPENNRLIFQPLQKMTTEILTYDNLRSVKFGAKYGAVNSVVLARTPAEDNVVLTDEVDISANGLTEVKLANNEILDDDRENLIQPIFDVAKGFYFTPATAETEGHGWHEIGDRIRVENLENSWEIIVTNSKITLDGGIKETLQSVAPTETQTNYARAGGIIKTIYNTEIKVDKQNQQISSVVEKMETIDDEIANNFTEISQNLENITQTVQHSGGANLVKNSVGYAIIDGKITGWEYAAEYKNGEITAVSAPEIANLGVISGNKIQLKNGAKISQRIVVAAGNQYSLSFFAKKSAVGSAKVSLKNQSQEFAILLDANKEFVWQKFSQNDIVAAGEYFDLIIETSADAVVFAISDLMFAAGSSAIWQQANGEILNTQVQLNTDGIIIKSSIYDGDYLALTPLEVAGFSDANGMSEKVFALNRDTTIVQKLFSQQQISMPPLKIVPFFDGDARGWAIVKSGEEN